MHQRRSGGLRQSSKSIASRVRHEQRSKRRSGIDTFNSLLQVAMLLTMGYLILMSIPSSPVPQKDQSKSVKEPRRPEVKGDVPIGSVRQSEATNFSKYGYIPKVVSGKHSDSTQYHVIFSTGCSTFQDWQSYIFFYHAWKSGQSGQVTRIASGCDDKNAKILKSLFEKEIKPMQPDRFHLHLTPNFQNVKPGIGFKYFNKPFGLRHWMQNALGYPQKAKIHDNSIVILLDPDQIIIRPITKYFRGSIETWRPRGKSKVPVFQSVEHGQPFAQQYGFGMQWKKKVDINYVCNCTDSRILTMEDAEAMAHYSLGPPYVATARDMYAIAMKWTEVVLRVHDDYPHLLAEMFGYCFAAAHLNLPHRVAHSFMVSDPGVGGEGWKLVDKLPNETVCNKPTNDRIPHVIHYCQRYMLGKWFLSKYKLRKDFLSCEAPLLKEPPPTIVEKDYQIAPDGSRLSFKMATSPKRHAFMLCQLIPALNRASEYYKQQHCPNGANYERSYIFHRSIEEGDD